MSAEAPARQDPAPAPAAPPARGSLARNALFLVMGQVATTVLTVVLNAVIGRRLGAAEYGLLFLVTSIANFGYVFVEGGQGMYCIREVARRPRDTGALLGSALALRAAVVPVVTVLAVAVAAALGYDGRTRLLLALMMACMLPQFVALGYSIAFRGQERMQHDALVGVALKVLVVVLALGVFALGGGLTGYVLTLGASGLGGMALAQGLYRRMRLPRLRVDRAVAREILVGSTPLITMSVAIAAQPYVDAVLLSKLTPREVVGWYGAASAFYGTLLAPAYILGAAAYPRLSKAAGDAAEFGRTLAGVLRPMLLVATLGAVGTWLFAGVAVGLVYGQAKFGPAGATLQASAPALLLVFLDMVLGGAILATGKAKALAAAKLGAIAVTTLAELALIPLFQARAGNGGIGVMLAQAVGELVMLWTAVRLAPRGTLGRAQLLDAGRAAVAAAATVALLTACARLSPFLTVPLCVAVFVGCALAVRLVGPADLALLLSALRPGRRAGGGAAPGELGEKGGTAVTP